MGTTDEIRMNPSSVETDGRLLSGYIAVFDSPAEIQTRTGSFVERIKPGAFSKSLAERAGDVKVMFNHGMYPAQFENMPLGKASVLAEDARGLYMEVPLAETSYNDDLIALVKAGAVDGMSFRGEFLKDKRTRARAGGPEQRDVIEIKLLEGGPVTWPAYSATSVGVRSREDYLFWEALGDEQREAFRLIQSGAIDLRTLIEAAEGTSGESRDETTEEPPEDGHSQVRTPAARRQLVRRALLREKGILP